MKNLLIENICAQISGALTEVQLNMLRNVLIKNFADVSVNHIPTNSNTAIDYLKFYLDAKKLEGCSENTIRYYRIENLKMLKKINKPIHEITTTDLRNYLSEYSQENNAGNVTLDNMRRTIACFFKWLEDEDYIIKSPARKIHKIKSAKVIKEAFSDEDIAILVNSCENLREKVIISFLSITGVRVSELLQLNRDSINIDERECKVLGKGNKERLVYIDASTKVLLTEYLAQRTDSSEALFVSRRAPYHRLTPSGLSKILKRAGKKANIGHIHPHKFRRSMATRALAKGMSIESVQHLLGHEKVDTTLMYALIDEELVKMYHQRFLA